MDNNLIIENEGFVDFNPDKYKNPFQYEPEDVEITPLPDFVEDEVGVTHFVNDLPKVALLFILNFMHYNGNVKSMDKDPQSDYYGCNVKTLEKMLDWSINHNLLKKGHSYIPNGSYAVYNYLYLQKYDPENATLEHLNEELRKKNKPEITQEVLDKRINQLFGGKSLLSLDPITIGSVSTSKNDESISVPF